MLDKDSPHKKMQELCDCYAETDPLREMAFLSSDADGDEAALKWLALAVLHGVDRNAREISLEKSADGGVTAMAEYREATLPSPGMEIGDKVIDAVRRITHIEDDKGELPLSVGIRDSSVEILVKVKRKDGKEKISLFFGKS
jgi:hypothetical protein